METTKKINGNECRNNILKAISTYNMMLKAMRNWNPEVRAFDRMDAAAYGMTQIVLAMKLVDIAKMFDIKAEFSRKEDCILVDGKLCSFSEYHEDE